MSGIETILIPLTNAYEFERFEEGAKVRFKKGEEAKTLMIVGL